MKEYKCDINKPYHFADDTFVANIIATTIFIIIFGGLFGVLLAAKPTSDQDILPKTIAMIIIALICVPLIIFGSISSIKAFKEKKKFEDIILNSSIRIAIVVSLSSSSASYLKKKFYVTLRIDGTNDNIIIPSKSKQFWANRKVAIAKYEDKQYILTKYFLVEE